jgi:mannose-6-phosphate isomerase-like protein (cupin superfamily)
MLDDVRTVNTELSGRPIVRTLAGTAGTPCPCGTAYRIVRGEDGSPASVHVVDILLDSRRHYHRTVTEIYTCLEGRGLLEVDDQTVGLEPGVVVVIPPGLRHRAIPGEGGTLRVLNTVIPPFTAEDEWFDEDEGTDHDLDPNGEVRVGDV